MLRLPSHEQNLKARRGSRDAWHWPALYTDFFEQLALPISPEFNCRGSESTCSLEWICNTELADAVALSVTEPLVPQTDPDD